MVGGLDGTKTCGNCQNPTLQVIMAKVYGMFQLSLGYLLYQPQKRLHFRSLRRLDWLRIWPAFYNCFPPQAHRLVLYSRPQDLCVRAYVASLMLQVLDLEAPSSELENCGRDANDTSSNFKELRNLVESLEEGVQAGNLPDSEIFIFHR